MRVDGEVTLGLLITFGGCVLWVVLVAIPILRYERRRRRADDARRREIESMG